MTTIPPSTDRPTFPIRALSRLFDNIQVDDAWVQKVRELAQRGTIVYVQRNLNFIDYIALDHLTRRYDLPRIEFVNALGLGVFEPAPAQDSPGGWLQKLMPRRAPEPAKRLRAALENGGSANLFLKRPPGMLDLVGGSSGGRGVDEGDDLIRTLIDMQRGQERPILLLPQVFVWTKRPDTRGIKPLDFILGPREWPSALRTAGQILYNYEHVALRAGKPLELGPYLANSGDVTDAVRIRRVTYAMLRRVERERRSVTGPAEKPTDRVREEILRSPKLRATIGELAGERAEDRAVLAGRALAMLKELQATPESTTLRALASTLHRGFQRIYAGIEYDKQEIERIRDLAKKGTLVLLPCHKSHIDYLVLSYVFYQENLQLPLIAAGENLSFFPLGPVLRRGGAFFIRRSFKGDRLYTTVVDAYVRRLIRDGYPIEVFIEGGRSRNGKLLPPKLGLLSMIVEAALNVDRRPVYFVPVSIGYERVVESDAHERELAGAEKQAEDTRGLLRSTEVLRHRYGKINLQVGDALSLPQLRAELGLPLGEPLRVDQRRAMVQRLGNRAMDEINRVTAVTPASLTALCLLSNPRRGIAHEELVERSARLLAALRDLGARVTPTVATQKGKLRSEAIREAALMFVDAGFLELHSPGEPEASARDLKTQAQIAGGAGFIYTLPEQKRPALDATKNVIVHFFVERALVAIALCPGQVSSVPREVIEERVRALSRLFKFEFRFQADRSFEEIFSTTLSRMSAAGDIGELPDGRIGPGPGRDGWSGQQWLLTYQRLLRSFLEGYRVAARGLLALVKTSLSEKDLLKKSLATGNRMFLAGEVELKEAISKPVLANAFRSLTDQGYLTVVDGKYQLSESFRSQMAVQAIESRIAGFLPPTAKEAS